MSAKEWTGVEGRVRDLRCSSIVGFFVMTSSLVISASGEEEELSTCVLMLSNGSWMSFELVDEAVVSSLAFSKSFSQVVTAATPSLSAEGSGVGFNMLA